MNRTSFILPVIIFTALFNHSQAIAQEATTSLATTTENTKIETTTLPPPPFNIEPTLSKTAQTRLLNLTANMSDRMDGVVARLQNVNDRLNSRLNKMTEAGQDVSAARNELSLAQNKLDEAKRNLATIDNEVSAFIGSVTPSESWVNLKNTYLQTAEMIISAHQNVLMAIKLAQNNQSDTLQNGDTSTSSSSNI